MTEPVLAVHELSVRHGGLMALDDVSFDVAAGQVAGLIGPNGAGKTTLVDALTGFTPALHGRVRFDGTDITEEPPHRRARLGLARTFQSLELFDDLTVQDNLHVAEATPTPWSTLTDAFWPKRRGSGAVRRVLDLLDLGAVAARLPTELSNGDRHRVALARALVTAPRLLLLDEPAAGLDPAETAALGEVLRRLPALGTTVLVIDHDMSLILGVCDVVHLLDFGRLVTSGPPEQIRHDPAVIAAYLGTQA